MTDLAAGPLFGLPLPELWFGLLFLILGTFLFLDGFDFGAGLLFATVDDEGDREGILAAIGPFWDGNEVWLVVFGGALFAAFPPVYAGLFSRHYLLMFAILGALILRGLAPEMYEQRADARWKRWWGRSFVVGSVTAPFFLGMFVANWLLGATASVSLAGVVVGLAVVALTVVAGAAFLRVKLRGQFRDRLRTSGRRAVAAYLLLIVAALGYVYATVPRLRPGLTGLPVLALVAGSVLLAGAYVLAGRADRPRLELAAAAGQVYALVGVVATLLFPFVDPATGATVRGAIVSTLPLNLMSVGAAVLLPPVVIYFVVLYSAFRGPVRTEETYS